MASGSSRCCRQGARLQVTHGEGRTTRMVQRFQMIEMVMRVMPVPLIFLAIRFMASGLASEAREVEPHREGSHVAVAGDAEAGYRLLRNGEPFVIRGAGGEGSLETLAACGGNAIRTWDAEVPARAVDGRRMIDRAHDLGLTVTVGLWLGHERHGFDYADAAQLAKQQAMVEEAVVAFRDHPALLVWGLGNEMEGPGDKPVIWREVNRLARRIKELDPHHPVMTIVANISPEKLACITKHAPDIDILGINVYGGAGSIASRLRSERWTKPYCITEFGLPGPWEVGHTAWKAPIEPSSREKAATTHAAQVSIMEDAKHCLGSYVFLWGQKQEATASWFGMFLPSGEKTIRVDAMARAWTGHWPSNRAPVLEEADVPWRNSTVDSAATGTARVRYRDPDGDPLEYHWEISEESSDRREGGDAERRPAVVADSVVPGPDGSVAIHAPKKPGAYRLFVTVKDGHGSGAMDNWAFQVAPSSQVAP